MQLIPIESAEQLQSIKNAEGYSIIFKHNTTCPISKGAYRQMEACTLDGAQCYLLDIHAHRDLSDDIANQFGIPHQSPQVLLIKDGNCTYNEALYHITPESLAEAMNG